MTESERTVLKARIATIAGVKLAVSILTLYYFPSWHTLWIVIGLSIPWVIAGVYYLARVGWVRYRLWQLHALRRRLIYEEWHVPDDEPDTDPIPTKHSRWS